jgi:hypothetical protein
MSGKDDYDIVNIRSNDNLKYWAEQLGVTTKEIRHAVGLVGPNPERVRAYVQASKLSGAGDKSGTQ